MIPFLAALILAPRADLTAPQVLQNVRKAVHFEAYGRLTRGLSIQGTARAWGEQGAYTLQRSPHGAYVVRYAMPTISSIPQTIGFDGQISWTADWTGATLANDPGTRWEWTLYTDAETHGWLAPMRKYTVRLGTTSKDLVDLKLTSPDGYGSATVSIDRTTWLPRSMTIATATIPKVVRLEGYRPERGILLPHHVVATRGASSEELTMREVKEGAASDDRPYRIPEWKPADTRFDHSKPTLLETRGGPSGHLLVHPLLNGKDVGWFILDTGTHGVLIDPKAADSLAMPRVGEYFVASIANIVRIRYRKGADFSLGQATIRGLLFGELDMSQVELSFGVKVVGICGYDLFRRTVVEIDLTTESVNLYDPARYRLAGASWQPLGLARRTPYVTAEFGKSLSGPFRLDTGAMSPVIFNEPAVRKYHLGEGQDLPTREVSGPGGEVALRVGKLPFFKLGRKTFDRPEAEFSHARVGVMADRFLVGNIGLPFLRPFKLVFDYGNSRIAFVPREDKGCKDSRPDAIVARETVRDTKFQARGDQNTEDNVQVDFDPYLTRSGKDASRFSINPLDTRQHRLPADGAQKWRVGCGGPADGRRLDLRVLYAERLDVRSGSSGRDLRRTARSDGRR